MSGQPSEAILIAVEAFRNSNYGQFAVSTLIWYEYLITLQDEASLFWYRKWTVSAWIFVASRYLLLAITLTILIPSSPQACNNFALQTITDVLPSIGVPLITGVFASLRVFALLDRNCYVASCVFFLGLIPAGISIIPMAHSVYIFVDDALFNSICEAEVSSTAATSFRLNLLGTTAQILSDSIVVLVTWWKTYSTVRQANALQMDMGISAVIFRDGSIYFLALLAVNVAPFAVSLFLFDENPLAFLPSTVPLILISRFILNLRQIDRADVNDTRQSETVIFHSPTVHSIMGNMGESLEFGHGQDVDQVEPEDECGEINQVDEYAYKTGQEEFA